MLEHSIVTGQLPDDGMDILAALNDASKAGYQILSTTSTLDKDGKIATTVILGRPVAQPANQRSGISMTGGGPRKSPQDVDQNAASQQEGSAGS